MKIELVRRFGSTPLTSTGFNIVEILGDATVKV